VFLFGRTAPQIEAVRAAIDKYLELLDTAIQRSIERGGNELLESMAAAFAALDGEFKPMRMGEMLAANVIDGVLSVGAAASNALYVIVVQP